MPHVLLATYRPDEFRDNTAQGELFVGSAPVPGGPAGADQRLLGAFTLYVLELKAIPDLAAASAGQTGQNSTAIPLTG
jgi:hypothetical protein